MAYSNKRFFYIAHRNLISKALEELYFDEVFKFQINDGVYKLTVNENISYEFKGSLSVWDNIHIQNDSLVKYVGSNRFTQFLISDFLIETKHLCKMSDDTLSKYIEEANQTIYSDMRLLEKSQKIDLDNYSFISVDQNLNGHPKLIMNKGRIGFDIDDLNKYAPEFNPHFKLRWLGIHKDILEYGILEDFNHQETMKSLFKEVRLEKDFFLIPVHPWQWNKYLKVQFLKEIVDGKIIDLGVGGVDFTPQVSLRTLSTLEKSSFDIKLSLSILNTSCVRGIPGKYIKSGHQISKKVTSIAQEDEFLNKRLVVLQEVAAFRTLHPGFEEVENSSYRYKELFGTVVRESVESKLLEGQKALPTAALFHTYDEDSLIGDLIKSSGLSCEQWLKKYFEVVVETLYHLQVKHGLGLVSHGQNTIIILENDIPVKLIIKDFHGDLRISEKSPHLECDEFKTLDRLPPKYLIHDLITGHFITVLRYISRVLKEYVSLEEEKFYSLLGGVVRNYLDERVVSTEIDLLKEKYEKVLTNKVRFVAGYSETPSRLKPILGREIENPLRKYL